MQPQHSLLLTINGTLMLMMILIYMMKTTPSLYPLMKSNKINLKW